MFPLVSISCQETQAQKALVHVQYDIFPIEGGDGGRAAAELESLGGCSLV